ncbi:hypothetical protein SEA_BRUHMOMENT_9 [Arthrobacter phage BruhMoment]|nr:hypothetical protein SEA_BRUHMOMENT_9 [Arthrobacter phage BruhMoment]
MGRAALGAAAKSKTGSCRMTETEKQTIERHHSSVTAFLRSKVDEELVRLAELEDAR